MPHLTFPLGPDGPVLDAWIGLNRPATAALVNAGQPVPAPIQVRALIDTGTDATAAVQRVFRHLGLSAIRSVSTHTAGGQVSVNLFLVSLSIPGPLGAAGPMLVQPNLLVTELTILLPTVEALIGMDVLDHCLLVLDGPGKQFTLAF